MKKRNYYYEFLLFIVNITYLLLGYLLGSIPTGFLAGKYIAGIDLRSMGSGSTGATNVLRHVGKRAALIVFLIDVFDIAICMPRERVSSRESLPRQRPRQHRQGRRATRLNLS